MAPAPKRHKKAPAPMDPSEEEALLKETTAILEFTSPDFDAYSALRCSDPGLLDLVPSAPELDNIEVRRER